MSVPDSDLLISISEVLETPVSTLLGKTIVAPKVDDLKTISEKLEVINLQLALFFVSTVQFIWGCSLSTWHPLYSRVYTQN